MVQKLDRLRTPSAISEMKEYYKKYTINETAAYFKTSHETIRRILRQNDVRIRRKGEHTDSTKIEMAAYKCANTIRTYPQELWDQILLKINDIFD